jgi:hypothetical protein
MHLRKLLEFRDEHAGLDGRGCCARSPLVRHQFDFQSVGFQISVMPASNVVGERASVLFDQVMIALPFPPLARGP